MSAPHLMLAHALLTSSQSVGSMPASFAPAFEERTTKNEALCAEYGGEMAIEDRPVKAMVDFNGDGIVDPIVPETSFSCSSSATLFSGGTGGATHHIFVSKGDGSYDRFEIMGHAYRVMLWDELPVLTVSVHSSRCAIDRRSVCMMSYTYHDGRFQSADQVVEAG